MAKYRYDITLAEFQFKYSEVKRFFRKLIIFLTLACFLPQPVLWAQTEVPSLGDTARSELSPAAEYKIGKNIMMQIRRDKAYVRDTVLSEYLNNIGNQLVFSDPQIRGELVNDFTFFGVRDRTLNAFALPGGFIGVHTGLFLATQNESELASVLSHEVGHVSQRHIARMISSGRHDILIPVAAALLAVVAASAGGGGDAAGAVMMGGQGLALQKQINFTREAEKEADRVGFRILHGAGFDTNGMVSFFQKLQFATRNYAEAPTAYLRTHPLTSERIADAEARTRNVSYRQHADSLDFYLMKARVRIIQDDSVDGLKNAEDIYENQIKSGSRFNLAEGNYGLALVAVQRKNAAKAREHYQQVLQAVGETAVRQSFAMANLNITILHLAGQNKEALKAVQEALVRFPSSRTLAGQYASALFILKQYKETAAYLRKQIRMYREDSGLHRQLARVYDAQGKKALMHMSMANYYSLTGAYPAAMQQLEMARKSPDVTFYDQSEIDALEREWREVMKEEKN